MTRTVTLFLLAAGTIALAPALAAEPALPLWEAGVFGGTAATPAYPGSSERSTRTLALPYLIYRGKVLRADRRSEERRVGKECPV